MGSDDLFLAANGMPQYRYLVFNIVEKATHISQRTRERASAGRITDTLGGGIRRTLHTDPPQLPGGERLHCGTRENLRRKWGSALGGVAQRSGGKTAGEPPTTAYRAGTWTQVRLPPGIYQKMTFPAVYWTSARWLNRNHLDVRLD